MTEAVIKTKKYGCRGIPGPGRPKGSKTKVTLLNSEYFKQKSEEEGKAIIDKFIDAAKRGQPWAIQEFMERNLGRVKEFVEVSAPDTTLTVEIVKVTD